MRKKIVVLIAIVAVAMGVSVFGTPATSQAVVITNVTVTGSFAPLFGPGCGEVTCLPVTLGAGQTLVLAQTLHSFNFDTSEVHATSVVHVTVDALPALDFTDTSLVMTLKNLDPVNGQFNEAQTYTSLGFGPGYQVLVGYADNVHTDLCGSHLVLGVPIPGVNGSATCFPQVFNGAGGSTPANFFIGSGAALPTGFLTANPNHCGNDGAPANTCWDSAVIEIVATNVPEPGSLLLLGSGLVGVAAWRRRHLKKNA